MALVVLNRSAILDRSATVLGMKFIDFLRFNEIALDEFTTDAFLRNIKRDVPIYMTESIIARLGYSGTPSTQKATMITTLRDNFAEDENINWWSYKNDSYKEFLANNMVLTDTQIIPQEYSLGIQDDSRSVIYPPAATGKGSTSTHHIVVKPIILKGLLMTCRTAAGKQIRNYYLALVDALETYMMYQNIVTVRSRDDKIDELMKKIDEERILAEERYNKLIGESQNIQDALEETRVEVISASATIQRMAGNCVVPNSVARGKLEVFAMFQNIKTQQCRVACVQWTSYNRTLSDYKKECGADDVHVCLKINYNANATIFWNSFCRAHEAEFLINKNGRKFHIAPNRTVADLREAIIAHCDAQMIASME